MPRVVSGKLLSVNDISDDLQVDPMSVRRWIKIGRLKAIILNEHSKRHTYGITPENYKAFLESWPRYYDIHEMRRKVRIEDVINTINMCIREIEGSYVDEKDGRSKEYNKGYMNALRDISDRIMMNIKGTPEAHG